MTKIGQAPNNAVGRYIFNHYSKVIYHRTPEQIESEKRIFGMPFNRWLMFPAAFIFQAICGSLYAWSVFNTPIDVQLYGPNAATAAAILSKQVPAQSNAPTTFYIAVGFFGLSAAINGPWLERVGPRKAALVGSTLFFIGNMIAAIGIHTKILALIYIGYGAIGGVGLGLSYISPVSALQKWFPDMRGVAAGFAVCGFGAGSIGLAKVPLPMRDAIGLTNTFITLGCVYFVVMVLCAWVFRIPPPKFQVGGLDMYRNKVDENGEIQDFKSDANTTGVRCPSLDISLTDAIFSREYLLMYIMFFGNSLAGLVFLSRLSNIVVNIFGKDLDTGATIVSINGGFNLLGRLFFSTASDRLGRKNCFLFMLAAQVCILASLPTIMNNGNYPAFLACIWILTMCYGGGFGCIPAFLCDMFGPSNIGAMHGIILTAWALAGVGGGLLFTYLYNNMIADGHKSSEVILYSTNFHWILAFACVGLFFLLFSRTTIRDRMLPSVKGEFTRIRVFGSLFRIGSFGFQKVTTDQEETEWNAFKTEYNAERMKDSVEDGKIEQEASPIHIVEGDKTEL